MRIDRQARPWIIGCVAILALAGGAFIYYWKATNGRPDGGSWPGLAFGVAGFAGMIVAMLLAVRKRARSLRLGRTYFWMQAHVWFGLISYPLILFHAGGFAWGGMLTHVLMWLFTVVFISGIFGIIFQQVIPTRLTREVPAETIADQIRHVQQILRDEAQGIARIARAGGQTLVAGGDMVGSAVATRAVATTSDPFVAFYEKEIVPFLSDKFDARSLLASAAQCEEEFTNWRTRLDESLYPAIARLESIVDERRQLARQRRLQTWLHGWLLMHVPLSYGLIVLATIHSIMALRFNSIWR